ncbi:annexin B11-like [Pseudomyrmex gracilis]|uniref:annexin B11-like n=1 Tax=Pseudomyrmex gracilis TaxID=219809 RepID=UPI000995A51E|nr:annexin B11-like [Pseudomyrmex gracilis]
MSRIPLFLTLLCVTRALASDDAKQQKRGIVGSDGWIGLSGPHGYGHGHPWSIGHAPWKGLKLPEVNLHAGLHLADAYPFYGRGGIALTPEIVKTFPVYITKHVVLEKPVPVPEPVIIEKPYHVPVPIEKIVHKPVPIPIPVPQPLPIPVEHPVPIPVKHPVPVAVPVQQPIPVPVKHPVPVPVPVPVPLHPLPPPFPLHPIPSPLSLFAGGLDGSIYAPAHLHGHVPTVLHLGHGAVHGLAHGFGHGLGHAFAHGYGHDYGYHDHDSHADHIIHEHKKRKTDKN